jgi:mono/diheme cytochrome c family protein
MKRFLATLTVIAVSLALVCGSETSMANGKADAATWVVDPAKPGDNLPPLGRSLFDRLFTRERRGKVEYDVPFPFEKLLDRLDAQLVRDKKASQPPSKRVLIPLGRSLQRNAAAPDYFKFPRVVVAVDSSPASSSALLLKDRIYLGYQEKSDLLEVISYNEAVGRFEFQLVKNYRAGVAPQVVYANRSLCFSCHQNGAPIFSRALWEETNANPEIAALLVASGKRFYGVAPERGVDIPYAIDIAIKRANGFGLTQRLWQEGCGSADLPARRCRATLFTAALRHALAAGRKASSTSFASNAALAHFRAESIRRWPAGLALSASDIPNRNPLHRHNNGISYEVSNELGRTASANVSARFDPLAPRVASEIWRADSPDAIGDLVSGLTEFISATDRKRLETALSARPASHAKYRLPCRFEYQSAQVSVQCESIENKSSAKLTGTLDLKRSSGRLDYLILPASGTFNAISLFGSASKSEKQMEFTPDAAMERRGADGNPLAHITFHFSANDRTQGSVVVDMRQEFSAIEDAVTTLAESEVGATLFAAGPFPREQLFAALFRQLGLPNITGCCAATEKLPPPQLEAIPSAPKNQSTNVVDRALPAFYPYCAACHGGSESSPPNFLRGDSMQVATQLRHCAPRLYVRLAMADVPLQHRDKTPMPPESLLPAFDTDIAGWRASPARSALLAQVGEWLKTETGNAPDLNQLLANGYEDLRSCLPLH